MTGHGLVGEQGDEREETQEGRCRAGKLALGPVPLRLDAQMSAHRLAGDLPLPAQHEPGAECEGVASKSVPREQGLGGELALRLAGSGMSPQRIGRGGSPVCYQTAVRETI